MRRTRTLSVRCESCSCATRSSRLSSVTLVSLLMRKAALPTCNSVRAPASAHRRSPVTSGRFMVACTHWSSPAVENLTGPCANPNRATRAGGSAKAQPAEISTATPNSSAAKRWGWSVLCTMIPLFMECDGPHLEVRLSSTVSAVRLFPEAQSRSLSMLEKLNFTFMLLGRFERLECAQVASPAGGVPLDGVKTVLACPEVLDHDDAPIDDSRFTNHIDNNDPRSRRVYLPLPIWLPMTPPTTAPPTVPNASPCVITAPAPAPTAAPIAVSFSRVVIPPHPLTSQSVAIAPAAIAIF